MQLYLNQRLSRQGEGKMPNTHLDMLDTVAMLYHASISSDGGILYTSGTSVNAL